MKGGRKMLRWSRAIRESGWESSKNGGKREFGGKDEFGLPDGREDGRESTKAIDK